MSDTPFSGGFKEQLTPGHWWYITYSAQSPTGSRLSTIAQKFDIDPEEFLSLDRVDYAVSKIQEIPANKDKKILILSWSKFTVPEAPSDV